MDTAAPPGSEGALDQEDRSRAWRIRIRRSTPRPRLRHDSVRAMGRIGLDDAGALFPGRGLASRRPSTHWNTDLAPIQEPAVVTVIRPLLSIAPRSTM